MSDIVINADSLSKMYKLYNHPKDRLKEILNPFRKNYHSEFWALNNVSFELERGESIGIVGKNGSGKSTLLKILTGVLTQTSGTYTINGTISSLLELGAGFNPELNGIENIYLQGLFHGMSRSAMEARVDAIAAFADIGDFLYQPVKMYSSGMFVRLAFSCSVYVDPDILIVDEALAVGDIFFTHKCMLRIRQMLDSGVALLYVSHDTETVKRFCSKGLWLDSGAVVRYGNAGDVVNAYVASSHDHYTKVVGDMRHVEPPEEEDSPAPESKSLTFLQVGPIIDIWDKHLFIHGRWIPSLDVDANGKALAVVTHDADAIAAFNFIGNELTLRFMRGDGWADPAIWVDSERHYYSTYFDKSGHGDIHIESITISLCDGEHHVRIAPSEAGLPLGWLGGTTQKTLSPDFRSEWHDQAAAKSLHHRGNGKGRVTCVELLHYDTEQTDTTFKSGEWVILRLHVLLNNPDTLPRVVFGFQVRDKNQISLFGSSCQQDYQSFTHKSENRFVVEWIFPLCLPEDYYSISSGFVEYNEDLSLCAEVDMVDLASLFNVEKNETHPYLFPANPPTVSNYFAIESE